MWSDQIDSRWLALLGVWSGDLWWSENWQRLGMRQYKHWATEFGHVHSSCDRQACDPLPSTLLCLVYKISAQSKLHEIKPCSLLQRTSWDVESTTSSFHWSWTKIETMNPPRKRRVSPPPASVLTMIRSFRGGCGEERIHLGNAAVLKEQGEVTHWMGGMTRRHILSHTQDLPGWWDQTQKLQQQGVSKAQGQEKNSGFLALR